MVNESISMEYTSAGIPVITDSVPGCRSSGYMVAVNTGSRDEHPEIFGLSHLLEHVVFRATKTRTSFQMSKEMEGAGGEMNAFTAKEMTAFYGVTIDSTANVAKDLVADIVSNPLIAKDDTELEKKIVLQEISMCENDPESYIHDLFDEVIWDGHELSQGEAGTRDVVNSLTNVDLREYYDERYRVPNLAVFACGSVDKDDVLRWAEGNFDPMSGGRPNPRKAPVLTGSAYRYYKRKGDHCYVGMGFRAFDANDDDLPALTMLNAVLGSGSSSRLFQNVREEKALVYSIYNYVDQYTDAGSMGTYMSATEENVLDAIETTARTYRELKDGGLTDGELQRVKNLVKGALIRGMESTSRRLYTLAKGTMLVGKPRSLEERLSRLDAVTEEDVMRVAEKVIRPEGLNVVMYSDDVASMKDFKPTQFDF
ncbi:M16 family metallopeptidase [Candidatus Methanarcanum hacksteinii]|uniref:M16 family metallopeptidase n=1 Tax=Candidatus Methanarcanum hacksteinii TaxID=2911857 RepID=UPI0037DCCA11